jgi:hypothetical protein
MNTTENTHTRNAFTDFSDRAERVKNAEPQRFPDAAAVGDNVRQGDIYIWKLDAVPRGYAPIKHPPTQLAPGNTQGSRHCLDSLEGVTVFGTAESENEYDGPILRLDCERTITHPEHGHWTLPPGIYGISFQRTSDSKGERRVQD